MKSTIATLALMLTLGIALLTETAAAETTPPSTETTNRPGALWFVHNQQKCDSALAELPKSIEKIRNIKIAGFSTEPIACIDQNILNQCKGWSTYGPGISGFDDFTEEQSLICELGNSRIVFRSFTTLNNGLVITRVSYTTPLGTVGNFKFYPDDPALKSLVARYGEPALAGCCNNFENIYAFPKFKDAPSPYDQLVWAAGSFTHYADKIKDANNSSNTDSLHIQLEINLSPDFYGRIRQQFTNRKESQKLQEATRDAIVPKF